MTRPSRERIEEIREGCCLDPCPECEDKVDLLAEIDALNEESAFNGMGVIQMTLSAEREKEIRKESRYAGESWTQMYDELFRELDRLREERWTLEASKKSIDNLRRTKNQIEQERDAALESVFNMTGQIKELSKERDQLKAKLEFRANTQVTGYCIRCEAMQTTFEALEKERDALKAEVVRLNRIIAKELTENDELGAEYT